jgi:hypothetical protein
MRQLRRFAVEHRKESLNWKDNKAKWHISFEHAYCNFNVYWNDRTENMSTHFDSEETAKAAIDAFRDELMWYFMEYRDSL